MKKFLACVLSASMMLGLLAGCAGAGVGGKLVNKEWIEEGAWDKITALSHALCENAQA